MNNTNKIKLLSWSDSPLAATGFGTVSKYVLSSLMKTGDFDVHQLAINHSGDFHDESTIPWQIQPARLMDPRDPHGMKMFLKTVAKGEYDIVWILNDLYVTHEVAAELQKLKNSLKIAGKKIPKIIYYYPVDCKVIPEASSMLDVADVPVCYTNHGRIETLTAKPEINIKLKQIPHGINTSSYFPAQPAQINTWRQQFFKISDETFLIVNVNRNSSRKQLVYCMQAFKEFRKQVPNSMLYLHTMVKDQGGDLFRAVKDLGLNTKTDVVFPGDYSPQKPTSEEMMNRIYNCADMFMSTHLGEGWGLTIGEAMACGLPVLVPNNTCMPQLVGDNQERGYMYPCNDELFIDNSGIRKKGLIPDITNKMIEVYMSGKKQNNPKVNAAVRWAQEHDWYLVNKNWKAIIDEAMTKKEVAPVTIGDWV